MTDDGLPMAANSDVFPPMNFGQVANHDRPRGVLVHVIDLEDEYGLHFGLVYDRQGRWWLVSTEGVAYAVADEIRFHDRVYTRQQVMLETRQVGLVDLADFVTVYNERYDSNHAWLYRTFNETS